jgi:hypothetical protein
MSVGLDVVGDVRNKDKLRIEDIYAPQEKICRSADVDSCEMSRSEVFMY